MKTLLIGNTKNVTKSFIKKAFPKNRVLILGETDLKTSRWDEITVFSDYVKENLIEEVFESYEFDQIVYFSNSLSFQNEKIGELERLQSVLNHTQNQEYLKFIYYTGPELSSYKQVLDRTAEQLCLNWEKSAGSGIKILHSPYLYSKQSANVLADLLENAGNQEIKGFSENPQEMANFVNIEELAELFYKILDSWDTNSELFSINNPYKITLQQVADSLNQLAGRDIVAFKKTQRRERTYSEKADNILKERYGWQMRSSILDDLPELYRHAAQRAKNDQKRRRLSEILRRIRSQGQIQKLGEVGILFLLSEILYSYTSANLQFRLVDIRLLFVVLISTVFGTYFGLFAAALSALALLFSSVASGTDWRIILYNTEQWVPFIAYLFVAAVCGFVQAKNQDENRSLQKENTVLKEQNTFVQNVYANIIRDKQKLKYQIISSRNGTAKLFHVFKQLDNQAYDDILRNSTAILGEWLETDDVRIYTFRNSVFTARLQASAKEIPVDQQTVELMNFPKAIRQINKGEIWVNKSLLEQYPTYAVGVRIAGKLQHLLWVSDVNYSQLSQQQINHFQMISQMIGSALEKAYYQEAARRSADEGHSSFDTANGDSVIHIEDRRVD
ncbi:hypothetical protein DDV21_007915 [Streptococcus chenjunshii]|uniref:NAD-dependent epimerase/dehydratase family protein n=1 Tax=Streptococcus chenjunshii TaxID=2173853 RepID=A0A372KNZ3_9STRE|nr:hypothetical protein [Streptococcus chenjunshii]AXQ79017.1 hypothetical protein DDV21_007915 [Streptococcus chenjunshii]RFU51444.1 hypothetical protein DDV22_03805 [Streptococcus chenjunshii]RFU53644.1 hypothetical protein DDV23_03795 [Streptococcus chenjunshii]